MSDPEHGASCPTANTAPAPLSGDRDDAQEESHRLDISATILAMDSGPSSTFTAGVRSAARVAGLLLFGAVLVAMREISAVLGRLEVAGGRTFDKGALNGRHWPPGDTDGILGALRTWTSAGPAGCCPALPGATWISSSGRCATRRGPTSAGR